MIKLALSKLDIKCRLQCTSKAPLMTSSYIIALEELFTHLIYSNLLNI